MLLSDIYGLDCIIYHKLLSLRPIADMSRPLSSILILLALAGTTSVVGQHSLQRFAYPINTDDYDEICPIMSYEEDYLFFTRVGHPDHIRTLYYDSIDLSQTLSAQEYEDQLRDIFRMISGKPLDKAYTSTFNQDVYFALSNKGIVASVQHPSYPINSALPNSICSTMGTAGDYVIVNQFYADGSLRPGFSAVSFDGDTTFSWPRALDIDQYRNLSGAVNVSMSADGQLMFLAMQGADSQGDHDLYLSRRLDDKHYSKPHNITDINTRYRESTPFISKDGQRLYFSSDRPGGYGGMDIYVCEREDQSYEHWSTPSLLKQPLNSSADDTHPYVALDENTMLFNSNRDGSMDILRAKINRDDTLSAAIEVRIRIIDETGRPIAGEINWSEAYDYEPAFSGFFKPYDGHYTYHIEHNIPHLFYASRRTQTSQRAIVDPQELLEAGMSVYHLDLFLELDGKEVSSTIDREISVLSTSPIVDEVTEATPDTAELTAEVVEEGPQRYDLETVDKDLLLIAPMHTVILRNIYFTKGRSEVVPASYRMLQKLARVLVDNPEAIVQIEGHTDNVGDPKALKMLSEARASAIRRYLIDHGVAPDAVKTIGYGKSQPLTNNETERDRRRNRRVEIRVLQGGQGTSN